MVLILANTIISLVFSTMASTVKLKSLIHWRDSIVNNFTSHRV